MRTRLGNHLRSNVVGYLALFVALGGTSYAAMSLPADSVGTRQLRNGAVTAAKVRRGSLLANDFKAGQLPRGPRGPKGAPGASPATYWAVVRDGLARSTPGVSLVNSGPGFYVLQFPTNVSQCAWVVGNGNKDASAIASQIVGVRLEAANALNQLDIQTKDPATGNPVDNAGNFHIAVLC